MFKFYSIIRSSSGRNNSGSITVRHRGPAAFSKKTFNFFTPYSVSDDSFTRYFFRRMLFGKSKLYVKFNISSIYTFGISKNSTSGPLYSFKPGTFVRDIAGTPKGFPKYVRSRYSRALLIKRFGTRATLRIPSGEIRKFKSSCVASLCPNKGHVNLIKTIGFKAGHTRSLGFRPRVRGCAINPVDHPHGGRTGESRPSVSPWARLTKGYRTRTKKLDKNRIVLSAQQFHDRQIKRLFYLMVKDYKYIHFVDPKFVRPSSRTYVYSRSSLINYFIIGQKHMVYDGHKFKSVTPREEMVGTQLGNYSFTKITGAYIHKQKRKKKEKKRRGKKK